MRDSQKTLVQLREEKGAAVRGQSTSLEKDYLRLTSLPRWGMGVCGVGGPPKYCMLDVRRRLKGCVGIVAV